jgi:hypothetical protein
MQMRIRRPSPFEAILQLFFGGWACLFVLDLIEAASVRCDLTPGLGWCRLWGGTEGPVGMAWNYRSQSAYVAGDIALVALLATATLAPLVAPKPVWGFVMSVGVVVLGLTAWNVLGPMLV